MIEVFKIYGNEINALKYFIEQNTKKEHPDHIMSIILERIMCAQNSTPTYPVAVAPRSHQRPAKAAGSMRPMGA